MYYNPRPNREPITNEVRYQGCRGVHQGQAQPEEASFGEIAVGLSGLESDSVRGSTSTIPRSSSTGWRVIGPQLSRTRQDSFPGGRTAQQARSCRRRSPMPCRLCQMSIVSNPWTPVRPMLTMTKPSECPMRISRYCLHSFQA